MCGIVGIYNFDKKPIELDTLRRMTDIQRHRGPDDQGLRTFSFELHTSKKIKLEDINANDSFFEGGVGFNRLSILDLSTNGHQPMCNSDESVIIVFNGEIYNAFEYKKELEQCGFCFKSNTDTEVILYLYEHFGFEVMLSRLNGMFAICIIDLRKQEFFLARDRLGIKPLYWYKKDQLFMFSSEVKSFLEHPDFESHLDHSGIGEYLMFRYCSGNGFLLENVQQLPPGHWMCLSLTKCEQKQYWSIPHNQPNNVPLEEALDSLEHHLTLSIKRRLLSDVKLGCQLSGGIDSSIVTKIATQFTQNKMDTISIIFDDPQLSEEKWVDIVASDENINSHKYTFTSDYFFDNFAKATWHLDQPLNVPNSVGIFSIAEYAKPMISVLLSGEGADELLCGYDRFLVTSFWNTIQPIMPLLRSIPYIHNKLMNRFSKMPGIHEQDWFITSSAYMPIRLIRQLLPNPSIDLILQNRRDIFNNTQGDFVQRCSQYELQTHLVDLLIRQDKMTMAHSVENRVPFLDHELVEMVRQVPGKYLSNMRWPTKNPIKRSQSTKQLLKLLSLKYFDSEFVYRTKSGFPLPLRTYFTHPRFKAVMEDILLPGMKQRQIFKMPVLEHWWKNIETHSNTFVQALWICTAFEVWAQQFLDRKRINFKD